MKRKLIKGIDYCLKCSEPVLSVQLINGFDNSDRGLFSPTRLNPYFVSYCNNEKCSRYGLLTRLVKN